MNLQELITTVADESRQVLANLPVESVHRFIQAIDDAKRVFCAGQGRSGYILRCFCLRLMHLGYQVFFVGETITPRIEKGDMLVAVSGSGETALTYELIRLGHAHGALTYGVVGVQDSPIGRALDHSIWLPAGSKKEGAPGMRSVQPPGSLFEQAAFVLFETIILALYQRQACDSQALLGRHANLE